MKKNKPAMIPASATTPTTTPAAMPAVLDEPPPLDLPAADADADAASGSAAAVIVTTEVWPAEISLVTTVACADVDDGVDFVEEAADDEESESESDPP